jgi:hypothetical protein
MVAPAGGHYGAPSWAALGSGRAYDVEKTCAASQLAPAAEQAAEDLGTDLDGQFEVMDAYLCNSEPEPSLV